jgi:uncharacterized membrane protein YbhN (UPF0104 family)
MAVADHVEEPLALRFSARRAALLVAAGLALVVSVVLLAPAIGNLPGLWHRLEHGSTGWLALALVLELLSFAGHIVLFRAVSVDGSPRIGLRASTEITFAGHAATRLFASAGAGGVALTAWALRRAGMARAEVAARMTTFLVLLYSVYMAALVIGGLGLAVGLLPGGGSAAITLAPAALGAVVVAVALATQRIRPGASRLRRALGPVGAGVRDARRLIRSGNPGLLGALMWWGFDVAVLYACFAAFGAPPPVAVVIVAYFVGTLANTLPLPGGIGGVEGGMVGALAAFGVDPGFALVAVLAYRAFAFWLPILPGAVAFASLRRTVAGWAAQDAGRPRARRRRFARAGRPALACAE